MSIAEQNPQEKKMAQRLRELEERDGLFQAVLDGLPDAIEIIDRDFNVLYLNAAAEKRTGRGIQAQKGEKCHIWLSGRPMSRPESSSLKK